MSVPATNSSFILATSNPKALACVDVFKRGKKPADVLNPRVHHSRRQRVQRLLQPEPGVELLGLQPDETGRKLVA